MEHQPRVIYRHDEPTKLDTANCKTLCKVGDATDRTDQYEWFIQTNIDPETPKWISIGFLDSEDILLNLINVLK